MGDGPTVKALCVKWTRSPVFAPFGLGGGLMCCRCPLSCCSLDQRTSEYARAVAYTQWIMEVVTIKKRGKKRRLGLVEVMYVG